MKETTEKVYRCDHCNKHLISKGFMVYHERWCKYNPVNKHKCFDYCIFLQRKSVRLPSDDSERDILYYSFTCKITGKEMYSSRLEKKFAKKPEELLMRTEGLERMPLTCDLYNGSIDISNFGE